MEKEQIIKGLECCGSEGHICGKCPYQSVRIGISCRDKLSRDALALIKELTEEIERLEKAKYIYATVDYCADDLANALEENKRLTEENERLSTALANYDRQTEARISEEYYTAEAYDELREENERLTGICESYALQYGTATDKEVFLKRERADTVREFAERLKYTLCINNEENTEFFDYSYTLETIDEVANKILNNTEEENGTK